MRPAPDQPARLEAFQDPAQITEINAQFPPQRRRRQIRAMRQLVQNTPLRQRKFAAQQPLAEQPELAGIETAEPPHAAIASAGTLAWPLVMMSSLAAIYLTKSTI